MKDDVPAGDERRAAPVQLEFTDAPEDERPLGSGKVGLGEQVADRAGILAELFRFLWAKKLWWMVPMVVILVAFGVLLALAAANPVVGAFIYTLF